MSSRQTDTVVADCPDLEALAAFVDGRLEDGDRESVVGHLASCEDCYEVYAETLRIQEDLEAREERSQPAPVVVHPRSWSRRWLVGAAVAATLALAAGLAFRLDRGPTLSQIAASPELEALAWTDNELPRMRGGTPSVQSRTDTAPGPSFRIGVQFVDLVTAITRDQRDEARQQAHGIERDLESFSLAMISRGSCREIIERIDEGAPPRDLLEQVHRLEKHLAMTVDELYFSFGKWSETARLAALTGNDRHFERGEFKRFLRRIRAEDLSDGVKRRLDHVENVLKAETASTQLADVFGAINRLEGIR